MTNRKNFHMAHRSIAYPRVFCALALTSLVGCSSITAMFEPAKMDYRTAGQTTVQALEIPPDLTQLQKDNRYAMPDPAKSAVTASGYSQQLGAAPAAVVTNQIAPITVQSMHIERAGGQRWLVVKQTPEALWPEIKDFWQERGFLINTESPATGVMETDWAENRAKIPQDPVRSTIGKVFDSLYSTGERDKFRTRLERGTDGTTEIYISHRGAQEVVTGQQKDGTVWTPRPSDPDLEAEFLSRLMARLATDATTAKAGAATANAIAANAAAAQQPLHAKLVKDAAGNYLEDRDRVEGTYFVRYVDQSKEAKDKNGGGFLSRLFAGKDPSLYAKRYRVSVKGLAVDNSKIIVLNNDGGPEVSVTADTILSLLNEQLK
jgi:outer membrane protein assembly factor BamC